MNTPMLRYLRLLHHVKCPHQNNSSSSREEHGLSILGKDFVPAELHLGDSRKMTDALKQVRALLEEDGRGLWRFASYNGDIEVIARKRQ